MKVLPTGVGPAGERNAVLPAVPGWDDRCATRSSSDDAPFIDPRHEESLDCDDPIWSGSNNLLL